MELRGKKIAFLGDSITMGDGVDREENIFWNRVAAKTGAQCFGYGIGGTRIAKQRIPMDPIWDQDFVSRVDTMIPDADIVVVFGGTNDYGHGDAPFGSPEDQTADTFCGALNVLYTKLYARYPDAQLVVMTPTHRGPEREGPLTGDGVRRVATMQQYVQAIRDAAERFSIPVLDLWAAGGLAPQVPELRRKYMPDGLHPNDAGHERIANRFIGFMGAL